MKQIEKPDMNVKDDEILFEATSRNAQTFEGCTLRLYESGLCQKITYDKSDSLKSSKTEITVIGEKSEAVTEVKKNCSKPTGL